MNKKELIEMDKENLKRKIKVQTKRVNMKKRDLDEVGGNDPVKKKEYAESVRKLEKMNQQLNPKPAKKKTNTRKRAK